MHSADSKQCTPVITVDHSGAHDEVTGLSELMFATGQTSALPRVRKTLEAPMKCPVRIVTVFPTAHLQMSLNQVKTRAKYSLRTDVKR